MNMNAGSYKFQIYGYGLLVEINLETLRPVHLMHSSEKADRGCSVPVSCAELRRQ